MGRGYGTSEFRLLVSIPTAEFRSTSTTDVSSRAAKRRAIAIPTTPPPITYHDLLAKLVDSLGCHRG